MILFSLSLSLRAKRVKANYIIFQDIILNPLNFTIKTEKIRGMIKVLVSFVFGCG